MKEFVIPDFLKDSSVNAIHSRMLKNMPDDIDKGQNGFLWDFTRPTAIEKSEMIQFVLLQTIKNLFPQWAERQLLDYHAENRGIYRKSAQPATGIVTVTGTKKIKIPKGFKFCTESYLNEPSIEFATDEEIEIPDSGQIDIPITAIEAGRKGNVAAETIVMMSTPLRGISKVRNVNPTYYGYDEEDDESLRERVADYDEHQGESFVGSVYDYKRWAESVAGVGYAKVLSAQDDTGLVRIAITDANGEAASEKLCTEIYNFIMRPNNPESRLAPINANLIVTPPTIVPVDIDVKLEIETERSINWIRGAIVQSLTEYYKIACKENAVKYSKLGATLLSIDGILDYSDLLINKDIQNIPIKDIEMPMTTVEQVVIKT